MKKINFFLFLFLITSCKTIDIVEKEVVIDQPIGVFDTTLTESVDDIFYSEVRYSDLLVETSSDVYFEDEASAPNYSGYKDYSDIKHIKKNSIKTDSIITIKKETGLIAYSIPIEMVVGKNFIIKIRISKDKSESSKILLVNGERDIKIGEVDSKVSIEDIQIDDEMMAYILYDTTAFTVNKFNTGVQEIDDEGYTEWSWVVIPRKVGDQYIKLIVKIKSSNKDIVVFDKAIHIKTNISYFIINFIKNYWQWIITTLLLPFIIFLYKKYKGEKQT